MIWIQVIILDIAIFHIVKVCGAASRTPRSANGHPTPTGLSTDSTLPVFQEHEKSHDRLSSRDREGIDSASYAWDATEAKVVAAITKSCRSSPTSPVTTLSRPVQVRTLSRACPSGSDSEPSRKGFTGPTKYKEWDLFGSILRDSTLDLGVPDVERSVQCLNMFDILKLRALFLLAYLMIGSGSSDLYLADGNEVKMPIV